MRIFHIAERSRWQAAQLAGAYAWSTLDRTLDEEGFIHASREDQWEAVRERYYAGVRQPLVLLEIDTDRLTSPWSEDPVGDDTYPHIHGPLNPSAVVAVRPLASGAEPGASFFRLFLGEVLFRMIAAIVVMAASVAVAAAVQQATGSARAALGGLVATVVAGTVVAVLVHRGRNARAADRP